MPITDLVDSLSSNPYFGAGFGLVGVGAGVATLRKGFQYATVLFKRNCMITLEVPCRDKSYQWLLQWITQNAQNTQHLAVETHFEQHETGKISTHFSFVPSVGVHFFRYRGNYIRVERNREQQSLDIQMGIPYETVTLTCLGRNKNLYLNILQEARNAAISKHEGKTVMYVARGLDWTEFGHARKRRPISSVILEKGKTEKIVGDIKEFIDSSLWYEQRGIPYRRGYLLYGPPGCGKTSFITALAGELEYSICVLNLGDRSLTDDRLNHLMSVAPAQSIILLEDIDAAFVSREDTAQEKAQYEGLNRLTFSGLLNMLDGVASTEGRLVFMTTNYLERLDPALIRPGRVDLTEYIGHATDEQLLKAYSIFYPEEPSTSALGFVKNVRQFDLPVSMAAVQGYFLLHKFSPSEALQNVQNLWRNKLQMKSVNN